MSGNGKSPNGGDGGPRVPPLSFEVENMEYLFRLRSPLTNQEIATKLGVRNDPYGMETDGRVLSHIFYIEEVPGRYVMVGFRGINNHFTLIKDRPDLYKLALTFADDVTHTLPRRDSSKKT